MVSMGVLSDDFATVDLREDYANLSLPKEANSRGKRNGNKNNAENQTERRGGAEPTPLNRLGIGCRFSAGRSFLFIGFGVMVIS